MSTKERSPRKFKVRVERASGDSYKAQIDPVADVRDVVADTRLGSGIMDLMNEILIDMVREGEGSPDGRG
jgi:hypothetical protein